MIVVSDSTILIGLVKIGKLHLLQTSLFDLRTSSDFLDTILIIMAIWSQIEEL